ncbi:MAG: folate family ECF transporter S component [Oscillospiraceae bacterium]|nr:folate family ECF transporter S component [Oscillospiraceae bacterium]
MARIEKSTAVYKTPFSKGYWRDAAMELKDTKMLVFAALIIALRVALKTLVKIPLAPNLDITPAFLANALGAMVYGPVVGGLAAIISDVLGVLLRGDTYFLPYVLTEISGSVIFAMFFYRQKITPTRVILSRFCICLFVNILMQTPIDILFQKVMYGKSTYVLTLPRIFKNLFMFPIESVVLTLFLRVMQPLTTRMRLTYVKSEGLSFTKKQVVLLLVLVMVGVASVFGYLFIHYNTTSITTGYTTQEVIDNNKKMQPILLEDNDYFDDLTTVTIIDYAAKPFLQSKVTYDVSVYQVADGVEVTDALWKLKKTPASKHEDLTKVGTAVIVIDEATGEVLSVEAKPQN